jgi:hypothetical protein
MFTPRKPWQLDRRTFLRFDRRYPGAPVAARRWGLRSGSLCHAGEMTQAEIPRRAYFLGLGLLQQRAVPKETGKDYPFPHPSTC